MADFFVVAEEEIVLAFHMVGVEGRAISGREDAVDAFRCATGTGTDPSGRKYMGMGAKVLILTEFAADLVQVDDIAEVSPFAALAKLKKGPADS